MKVVYTGNILTTCYEEHFQIMDDGEIVFDPPQMIDSFRISDYVDLPERRESILTDSPQDAVVYLNNSLVPPEKLVWTCGWWYALTSLFD